jgi:hypothetical protein
MESDSVSAARTLDKCERRLICHIAILNGTAGTEGASAPVHEKYTFSTHENDSLKV